MARRLEITVPNHHSEDVRICLKNSDKGDFNELSEKQATIIEIPARDLTIFYVTIPAGDMGRVLNVLKSAGCGTEFGTVVVTSLDCMKPSFAAIKAAKVKRISESGRTRSVGAEEDEKKKPTLGFTEFQTARLTTEEIYNRVASMAKMDLNIWVNLLGACIISTAGLISNSTVTIVAAMLISPLMGPILAATFGYRIADYSLAKLGIFNEIIMAATGFLTGCFFGIVLGGTHLAESWPTSEMALRGSVDNYYVSYLVASSSGAVLGVSITSGGVNSMVGVALSASLLPPIINSGLLATYAGIYASDEAYPMLKQQAGVSMGLYCTSVCLIFIAANTMFWLKDISPAFNTDDDHEWTDISLLQEGKPENNRRRRTAARLSFLRQSDEPNPLVNVTSVSRSAAGEYTGPSSEL